MENYLKSAISEIYGEDDDFILLGLTGRTGSGCSTVSKVLSSEKDKIKASLFVGDNPATNEDRKGIIIKRHFDKTWEPFSVIQVRSILTLTLIDCEIANSIEYIKGLSIISDDKTVKKLQRKLKVIKKASLKSNEIFYTKQLPRLSDEIKEILGESSFVSLYQKIGKNVRMSGLASEEKLVEKKFFTLADKVNKIVKEIRSENKKKNKKTLLVIDAIRSPLEARFFQERFASFYLMAVSCSDTDRKERLRSLGYHDDDISKLDDQEYQSRDLEDESTYSIQDIQSCLQRADLYLSNPNARNSVSEYRTLASQIIKFTSLMKRPGLVTPTATERCMQVAYTAKLNSGCISRQVGAVVTDSNFSIKSIGWNDTPHGQVPCNLRSRSNLLLGKDQDSFSSFEKNDAEYLEFFTKESTKFEAIEGEGRNISYCFKSEYNRLIKKDNQVFTRSLHAEENAFLQISKYGGQGIEGGNLFTTASPCELCAKKAYQLGIKEIFYIDPYPGIAMSHVIMGGNNNPTLTLFSGAIGRAFHYLYTPIIAYKDELNTLVCEAEIKKV